jgi:hypothetical protein
VIVPIAGWNKVTKKALRFAFELSREIKAIHVEVIEGECDEIRRGWNDLVSEPASRAGYPSPTLEVVPCPYRRVLSTIINVVQREARTHPERQVAVVIPEMVEYRWYNHFLHNRRAAVLKAMLYFLGNRRIIVVNVPWYLQTKD